MTDPVATSPAPAAAPAAPAAPVASAAPATAQAPAPAAAQAATQSAAATPPAQPGNATQAAPLKLALPEGSPLSEAHLAKISEMAQKQGWSQEVAQEVLARQSAAVQEHVGALEAEHKASIETWNQELTADKDIGGANLAANLDAGRRAHGGFGVRHAIGRQFVPGDRLGLHARRPQGWPVVTSRPMPAAANPAPYGRSPGAHW